MKPSHIIILAFLMLMYMFHTDALSCLKCNRSKCKSVRCGSRAVHLDACGCCKVCTKRKGQKCGGPWNTSGKCDKGLTCIRKGPSPTPEFEQRIGVCGCVEAPANCTFGLTRSRYGCLVCKRAPRCRSYGNHYGSYRYGYHVYGRSYRYCARRKTLFCNRRCRRCCYHSTTCAPNWYQRRKNCNLEPFY